MKRFSCQREEERQARARRQREPGDSGSRPRFFPLGERPRPAGGPALVGGGMGPRDNGPRPGMLGGAEAVMEARAHSLIHPHEGEARLSLPWGGRHCGGLS